MDRARPAVGFFSRTCNFVKCVYVCIIDFILFAKLLGSGFITFRLLLVLSYIAFTVSSFCVDCELMREPRTVNFQVSVD